MSPFSWLEDGKGACQVKGTPGASHFAGRATSIAKA